MFITALILGFLGSFHCVGMCGPIALALPLDRRNLLTRTGGTLIYNTGRIITYASLGVVFGMIGYSAVVAGYQRSLSVVTGVLIILFVLFPHFLAARRGIPGLVSRFINQVKQALGRQFRRQHPLSLFSIGLLNGLLPCGFVYLAMAGAVAAGTVTGGAIFMAGFGAGTLPAMLVVSLAGHLLSVPFRQMIRKAVPVFALMMGVMLILRGLSLDIPYVSPAMHFLQHGHTTHSCH